jgi:hypothetical protein
MRYRIDIGQHPDYAEGNYIIDTMRDAGVFEWEELQDGRFKLTECCDGYFYAILTREQLAKLGEELINLSELHT